MMVPPGSAVQGTCGIEFDGVAVVIFAFDEGLFGSLAEGDVDDGDGDADDLVDLVTGGLVGDEEGAALAGLAQCRGSRFRGRLWVRPRARGGDRVRTGESWSGRISAM